jgi:hypothetical protein
MTWSDKNGNLWLFGGWGYTPSGYAGLPNDLWEFNPSSNQWAWMAGDSNFGSNPVNGIYGDLGKFAAGSIPGSRWEGTTWTDNSGNFWLFGGPGLAASGTGGLLNDLWEFDPSTNQWAWMGGSSTLNCANVPQQVYCNRPGVYGTLGVPAASNIPGSRMDSFNWRDVNGNLWLFGGQGFDSNSNWNTLNDLWKFNPSTNQWAWMAGLSTLTIVPTGAGVYGTLGTPAAGNQPGRRFGGVSWTDKKGNFWLWGGEGLDANFTFGYLNDLWVYQPASPDFTISGTPVSITAGATTGNTSTITVTPTGGFTGSVTLTGALTTSPAGASVPPTFSFNSTSPVNINGNAAGGAGTLTIVTTANSSPTCASSNQVPGGIPWYAGSGAALSTLFLFVIPKRNRTWRSMLALVLSFMASVGGVVACSSGGGRGVACPSVVTPGTTAGTYIITVTATSGAITKTGTVTVTVH